VISHTDAINGATSGGVSVTVGGVNFGVADLSVTVIVLESSCVTSQWVSLSGIVCRQRRGSGTGSLVSMRVVSSGLTGTDTGVFTYASVVILLHLASAVHFAKEVIL
jgi:hypothetical protein